MNVGKLKKHEFFTIEELKLLHSQDNNIIGLMYEQKAIESIFNELKFNNISK